MGKTEGPSKRDNLFRWFPEFLDLGRRHLNAQVRLLGLAVLVGIVAGLGAIVFYSATRYVEHYALGMAGYDPQPRPAGESMSLPPLDHPFRPWLLLIIPTLGGLASGLLVYSLAPEAEGHGTDAVIAAYHSPQGQIRPRVPLVKIVASALTIGTGGSGGREGPIAQIGAGFGSVLANLLHLRPANRRILMAAGMGAGIAAIFRAPLAGALFASEVLYRSPEFEPEVIMPAAIASVVSYCTFGLYAGWEPLFDTPDITFNDPWRLGPYFLLMLFMIILAALYTHSFYGFVRLFKKIPIPPHFKPAIGAFFTGLIGLVLYYLFGRQPQVLAVLSFGYSAIQGAVLDGSTVTAGVLLAIAIGKILTTGLTIGSGGSGGVFGPSMVIGGCGGGAAGIFFHQLWPGLVPQPASFVIVGMAGFFAAAAKTPFSTLIIVSEMTGGYHLLLPALWVCVLAYMLSDKVSIYSSQVESRSRSPAHQGSYVREILGEVYVRQFVTPKMNVPTLGPGNSLGKVLEEFNKTDYSVLPVADEKNRLVGVVNLEELHHATQSPYAKPLILVTDIMRTDIRPLQQDDSLDRAQELFVENDLLALPIVDDLKQRHIVGMVRRYEVASTYLRHIHGPNAIGDDKTERFNIATVKESEKENQHVIESNEQSVTDQPDDDQL
ncbi:MAG: chloride channel protein [Thermoguttaceae bacterium]|jgi:CIC family chloride channel protein